MYVYREKQRLECEKKWSTLKESIVGKLFLKIKAFMSFFRASEDSWAFSQCNSMLGLWEHQD